MDWDLTNNSNTMINFYLKNNCMPHLATDNASPIISALYSEIEDAHHWLESQKNEKGNQFYNLSMARIKSEADIPMPTSIPTDRYVGSNTFSHIKQKSIFKSEYTVDIIGRKIVIHMVFENDGLSKKWKEPNIQKMNAQIDNMLVWLHVASKHATTTCAPILDIFIFLSSLEKRVPDLQEEIITAVHANTGFTDACPAKHGEIVVYRHEEWFKVFIHESFHALGLDFSSMQVDKSQEKIRNTFYIPTPILLFEAYTEFWARIINVLIFSFNLTLSNKEEKEKKEDFEKYVTAMLDYERVNAIFQMSKVLKHMNLEYKDLHSDPTLLERYQENTNVFVYYVITSILLSNYPMFFQWCNEHNSKLFQFEQTEENQLAFCEYVQSHFNSSNLTTCIKYSKQLITKTTATLKKYPKNKNIKTILETMRMSLCEWCVK